ncbi:MAG: hypothetical protein ACLFQK_10485 [Fibrobacterota bacterium]
MDIFIAFAGFIFLILLGFSVRKNLIIMKMKKEHGMETESDKYFNTPFYFLWSFYIGALSIGMIINNLF